MQVVFFEPLYDSYVPMARRAGAVPRIVQLHPPSWSLAPAELAAAFGPRTRLLVLNTPHNPTGKASRARAGTGWVGSCTVRPAVRPASLAGAASRSLHRALHPPAQVFTRQELQLVADLCVQHDCLVLLDEVYEHLVGR